MSRLKHWHSFLFLALPPHMSCCLLVLIVPWGEGAANWSDLCLECQKAGKSQRRSDQLAGPSPQGTIKLCIPKAGQRLCMLIRREHPTTNPAFTGMLLPADCLGFDPKAEKPFSTDQSLLHHMMVAHQRSLGSVCLVSILCADNVIHTRLVTQLVLLACTGVPASAKFA